MTHFISILTIVAASLLSSQAAAQANGSMGLPIVGHVEIAGIAQVQNGQLQINGTPIIITAQTQWEDVRVQDLNLLTGKWLSVDGQLQQDRLSATEIELDPDHPHSPEKELFFGYQIELKGPVSNNQIWGYTSSDNSLQPYHGLWLELDCKIDWPELTLSQCQAD